ncbi:MAG: prepilin peptidase [Patescibacteria group bacterium]|jgi:prepilin signal peptidase PulO-like enzyme (type II secretory pathway)
MIYVWIFVGGLLVGSFLNVVICRLGTKDSIVWGRSHCPNCQAKLSAGELIPVLSYLIQKGKCKHCQNKISVQYLLVEVATALIFVIIFWNAWIHFGVIPEWKVILIILRDWVFASFLIVIFVYDFKNQLILDRVTIPAMVLALIINLVLGVSIWSLLLGALVAFGFFFLQFVVSGGRWIGGGDLRLGALMGLMLGWSGTLVALLLAYVIGAVFSLGLIAVKRKKMDSQIAFGTFLSLGTIIVLLWGSQILDWYLNILL